MLYDHPFKNPKDVPDLLGKIRSYAQKAGPIRLMEVCGTHTMAIARNGIKSLLPEALQLLSGPGCPVCVTPANYMDMILELTGIPGVHIVSYGDLLRVPGSRQGDHLLARKSRGALVDMVYSPIEAVDMAERYPDQQIVFLGVGFETTAPGTAACILEAAQRGLKNFSVLCLLKKTEPALRTLIEAPDFSVDGFLCPGHVAAITGSQVFAFLPKDYHLPGVVAGFESADLLYAILELVGMIASKKPGLCNEYTRMVRPNGNPAARRLMDQVFQDCTSDWRGLGAIENSGYTLRDEYADWDAWKKFSLKPASVREIPGCCCGQVIRGVLTPPDCPLFGQTCSPQNPVGPCMVSGEGACAAAYQYGSH